jgi:hypothetical protein
MAARPFFYTLRDERNPMSNAWYDDLPKEEEELYNESVRRIKSAVEKSMSFEQATGLIDVADEKLKAAIIDDALKVLIAEMHFARKKSVEDVAKALKLPPKRVAQARTEMLTEVESAAIESMKSDRGQEGNA